MILNSHTFNLNDNVKWIEKQSLNHSDKALPRIRSSKLPIKNVNVNTDIFQCRTPDDFGETERLSSQQIKELSRQLELGDLDPITIYPVGDKYYLIDGHHRYEAYRLKGITQIPVKAFKGEPREALLYSIKENSKTKLSLTQEQRLDLAWRYVITDDYSLSAKKIGHLYSVSERIIGMMRRRKKEIAEDFPDNWWEAREDRNVKDKPDWKEKKIEKLTKELYKLIGVELTKDPDIVTEALFRLGEYRSLTLLDSLVMHNNRRSSYKDMEDDIDTRYLFLDNIIKGLSYGRDLRPKVFRIEDEAKEPKESPYI